MEGKKASAGQLRMIYGLAKKADIDGDILHAIVKRLCKKDSLAALSCRDAIRVIDHMRRSAGIVEGRVKRGLAPEICEANEARTRDQAKHGGWATKDEAAGRATEKQRRYLRALTEEMGWAAEPTRLRRFLVKLRMPEDVRFLTVKQASTVIEALKGMQKGGRAERRASG